MPQISRPGPKGPGRFAVSMRHFQFAFEERRARLDA